MSELPPTWAEVQLSALTVDASQRVPLAEEVIRYIDIGSVNRNTKSIESPQELRGKDAPSRARKQVAVGDTLVSMTRPNLNAVALVPKELDGQIASTGFDVLRPIPGIDPRWISYLVRTDAFVGAMSDLVQGALYPAVRSKDVRAHVVPLAPQTEQIRIANQLDILLTRVQACNDRFDAIPALLQRFRQTVLIAAASGDLTRDWRESKPPVAGAAAKEVKLRLDARRNKHAAKSKSKFKEPVRADLTHWRLDVPESWSVESVSAFAECLDHVRVPVTRDKRATSERLYPYFGANGQVDMVDDFLFDDELVMVTEDETFYGRVKPIAYRFSGRCWVNNHAHVLLAGDRVRADYLCFSLMHYDVQPWLTGTTGRAKLTQGALNALPLAVPPQAEMGEIVRRVNFMFALADRIEARCTGARTQAQRLTPLVLAKAFRGELVAQDPQDEPASVLLQRIAATAAQPIKAKTSRGRPRIPKHAPLPLPLEVSQPNWATLPDSAWAAPADPEGHASVVLLVAVLKVWGGPLPQAQARLATLMCQQPRLVTAVLPVDQGAQWRRLVGTAAEPLPAQVVSFQPATNNQWRRALAGMRARGDLIESGSGTQATWTLGPGAMQIETAGWPDGRAGWVVAHLQSCGVDAILPVLEPAARDFVNVKAA